MPVNDNDQTPANSMSFSDLALAMQIDEDTLMKRFAAVLGQRDSTPVDPAASDDGRK